MHQNYHLEKEFLVMLVVDQLPQSPVLPVVLRVQRVLWVKAQHSPGVSNLRGRVMYTAEETAGLRLGEPSSLW